MAEGPERRRLPRLKREVVLQYSIKELPGAEGISGSAPMDMSRTIDLSEGGIFFTSSREIPPQATLDIKLRLPIQRDSVDIEGCVVDCHEITKNLVYGVRVKFTKLKIEQKNVLRKFIQRFLEE